MARTNTYQHFCPAARALEVVGEKWSLLIVRDLLGGPRRFTDLLRTCVSITPKWLTSRLRDLEAAGVVVRGSEPGRREVWYSLTPAGHELAPVLGSLNAWGLRHAMRAPFPGEEISPARMMISFRGYLVTKRVKLPAPATWHINFGEGRRYSLRFDGRHWHQSEPPQPERGADVVVETTAEAWASVFVQDGRQLDERIGALAPTGSADAVAAFRGVLRGITGGEVTAA